MISVWFWNKYSTRPLHLLGGLGFLFLLLGGGCGVWSIILFAMGRKMANNIFPPMLTIFFIIIGMLLFIFGLMSEILVKTYYGTGVDASYSIREITNYEVNDENINHIT